MRGAEKESGEISTYIYIYIFTHMHIHIYIHRLANTPETNETKCERDRGLVKKIARIADRESARHGV